MVCWYASYSNGDCSAGGDVRDDDGHGDADGECGRDADDSGDEDGADAGAEADEFKFGYKRIET